MAKLVEIKKRKQTAIASANLPNDAISPTAKKARKLKEKARKAIANKPKAKRTSRIAAPKFYKIDLTGLPGLEDFIQVTSKHGGTRVGLPGYNGTEYKPEYDEQATGLALLGHKYSEMAEFFGVPPNVLVAWIEKHPSFAQAIRRGMDQADMPVVLAFRKRALGFTQETPGPYIIGRDGAPVIDPSSGAPMRQLMVQYFPPDSQACTKWLGSRQKKVWGESTKVESINANIQAKSAEEARKMLDDIFNAPPDLPPEAK